MKKYKVIINGNTYEVEIEEISASDVKETKAKTNTYEEKKNTSPNLAAGTEQIKAPIPGTILNIKFNNGDNVKAGQVLLILESMKMENEILATVDGKVSFKVAKGATVATDDVLCVIQ